ncbi:LysR family transcriptional regulator [Amycolatopsis sp. H20-H5]|uniref:LysR family transcriptional regulator n=1 Tax=Amycolatopsis sp. H20-H5 TaxID=3046309 RepID=UPI002DB69AE3|nr:LysR family transcriptional regulator [Amycolatopsis sp. H20-H5]MEC3975247.1 LysR family transcriptional regulator [Amycolatopsis sp. H20-H5]
MELRQLEYFVAVAEEANFTRAAERVHVAQPGVSAQIRKLERELGQPLLDRSRRTVRLTEVGAAALPPAKAALASVAAVRLAVDQLSGLLRGQVAIGMVTSYGPVDLPGLLARFHELHPAVEITLSAANSGTMFDAIRDGGLDLALVGVASVPPEGIEILVVRDEEFVAVVGLGDPLATRNTVTLAELESLPFGCLPKGTGLRTALDEALTAAGLRPRIAFEAGDPNVLAHLAANGLGVAIVPESLARAYSDRLHLLTVTQPRLRGRLGLAWRADGPISPAAQALISLARVALVA